MTEETTAKETTEKETTEKEVVQEETSEKETGLVTLSQDNAIDIINLTEQMGLNPQEQIDKQNTGMGSQPFLKIDHDDKAGKHGFYIQLPEGVFDGTNIHHMGTREVPVDELDLQIILFEDTRAMFEKGKKMPLCASANGKVVSFIKESMNSGKRTCSGCPYNDYKTDCKPSVRSLIGLKYKFDDQEEAVYPFMFKIPSGSLGNWNKFTKRLSASKVPVQSFSLKLGLDDWEDAYRYAKITFDINRPINQEELNFAIEAVKTMKEAFEQATAAEFVKADSGVSDSGREDEEIPM